MGWAASPTAAKKLALKPTSAKPRQVKPPTKEREPLEIKSKRWQAESKPKWRSKWQRSKWLPRRAAAWKSRQKKTPPTIPKDFEIDKDARYTGTVKEYFKWRGYGFITLLDLGVVPDDTLHVSWQNIKTYDRYPFLVKGMEVEFGLMKWRVGQGRTALCAKTVTMAGGGMIAVQDDADSKKNFVGGQRLRYSGKLQCYSPNKKAGWVVMDDGFLLEQEVEKEMLVEEHEINCGSLRPTRWMEDIDVEFGIVKDRKGRQRAYNVTLPGGRPMVPENIDRRRDLGPQVFKGTVHSWSGWRRWGFVEPESVARLPRQAQAALAKAKASKPDPAMANDSLLYFNKADLADRTWPKAGMAVTFQIYLDDKGLGAHTVTKAQS